MRRLRRVPISGWKRCVHEAASFESPGEYKTACLLDDAAGVEWWLRNDPVLFTIPTPVGNFEPDFLYRLQRSSGNAAMGILEIKGEIFWDGEGSMARIKADTACEWVRALRQTDATPDWQFAVVLEQDAFEANSLQALLANAQRHFP
jgi:hypothetical protein